MLSGFSLLNIECEILFIMHSLSSLFKDRSSLLAISLISVVSFPCLFLSYLVSVSIFSLFPDLIIAKGLFPIEILFLTFLLAAIFPTMIAAADIAGNSQSINNITKEDMRVMHKLRQSAENNIATKVILALCGYLFSVMVALLLAYLATSLADNSGLFELIFMVSVPVITLAASYFGGVFMALSIKTPNAKVTDSVLEDNIP